MSQILHIYVRRKFHIFFISMCIAGMCITSCGTGRNAISRNKANSNNTTTAAQKTQSTDLNPETSSKNRKESLTNGKQPIVSEAYTWLGTRYVYGGHSKSGTDCSGMVMEIFMKVLSIKLPRTARDQQKYCSIIDFGELSPGDLVFFTQSTDKPISHVGIYIGNGEIIHASESRGVIVSNLGENYFRKHYHSSGQVVPGTRQTERISAPNSYSTVHLNDLENVLNQKTDSILSSFMD